MIQKVKTEAPRDSGTKLPMASRLMVIILGLLICFHARAETARNNYVGPIPSLFNSVVTKSAQASSLTGQPVNPVFKQTVQAVIGNLPPASGTTGDSKMFTYTCDAPSEDHFDTGLAHGLLPAFAICSSDGSADAALLLAVSTGSSPFRLIRVLNL